jgi:hypothetical protein
MRTSYLRPSWSWWSRYQDSRPWGADAEGKCTERWVARTGSATERDCRRRLSKLGRTSGSVTALGPRKMVFSTLAVAVQACVTTQSRAAARRMFGGRERERGQTKMDKDTAQLYPQASQGHCSGCGGYGDCRGRDDCRRQRRGCARAMCMCPASCIRQTNTLKIFSVQQHQHRLRCLSAAPPPAAVCPAAPASLHLPFRYPIHTPPVTMREVISLNGTSACHAAHQSPHRPCPRRHILVPHYLC